MFTFPLRPEDLFVERARQMESWGIPARTVAQVRSRITDAWSDAAGGWTFEWTRDAKQAEREGRWLLAATLYGAARFPCVCTAARKVAMEKQVECYLRAAPAFPAAFERRVIRVELGARTPPTTPRNRAPSALIELQGSTADVPTHVFWPRSAKGDLPLLVLSGGVDTYKMELHRLAIVLARVGRLRVAVIDMPGTGESPGPLAPDTDEVYLGILAALQRETKKPVKRGVFGISFGGLWAAKLAMRGVVDAAVDIGGPVGSAPMDEELLLRLPNGMTGIVANAMGFDGLPTPAETGRLLSAYSLRAQGLLDHGRAVSSVLAINGLGDPYISPEDTRVFKGFGNAEVWLTRDGDHCAANQLKRMAPSFVAWLRMKLHGETHLSRVLFRAAKIGLPPLAT